MFTFKQTTARPSVEVIARGHATGLGGMSAKVLAASGTSGHLCDRPVYTLELRYQRFIHAEFMTHRQFSRNASSSRAIPVAKLIEQVRNDPAMPIHWGKNQPGMQANTEVDGDVKLGAIAEWRRAAMSAADYAEVLSGDMQLHKQIANRILEPYMFMSVVVTATEWDNFFELRCHPDAQPDIQELAYCMAAAMSSCKTVYRKAAPFSYDDAESWHLPYVTDEERSLYRPKLLIAASAARCARVSYLKHDGTTSSIAEDLKLFHRLVGSAPMHASPIEHQAYASGHERFGNFVGWGQFRSCYLPSHFDKEFRSFGLAEGLTTEV
jgi:hypothetical protein